MEPFFDEATKDRHALISSAVKVEEVPRRRCAMPGKLWAVSRKEDGRVFGKWSSDFMMGELAGRPWLGNDSVWSGEGEVSSDQ
jgi:hypothetical protein